MPAQTWILTGSPENYAATKAHGFEVIGVKERNRNRALEFAAGDRIVLYLTKVEHWKLAFQGQLRVVSEADGALLMDRLRAAAGVAA